MYEILLQIVYYIFATFSIKTWLFVRRFGQKNNINRPVIYVIAMKKKQTSQKMTLLATALAVELTECYSDKELNRIKIFLYQLINSLNSIQGFAVVLEEQELQGKP